MDAFTVCLRDVDKLDNIPCYNESKCKGSDVNFKIYREEDSHAILKEFSSYIQQYNMMNLDYRELVLAYMILYVHGGLYVKHNCTIKNPRKLYLGVTSRAKFNDYRYIMLVKSRTYRNHTCSSAMYFKPRDKLMTHIIDECFKPTVSSVPTKSLSVGSSMVDNIITYSKRPIDYVEWHELFGNSMLIDKVVRDDSVVKMNSVLDKMVFWIGLPTVVVACIVILVLSWYRDKKLLGYQ